MFEIQKKKKLRNYTFHARGTRIERERGREINRTFVARSLISLKGYPDRVRSREADGDPTLAIKKRAAVVSLSLSLSLSLFRRRERRDREHDDGSAYIDSACADCSNKLSLPFVRPLACT